MILLAALAWCVPIHATWTHTQVKSNNACNSGTTCAVTVTSTGAGHLGVAGLIHGTSRTISSVDSTTCNTTWTHAPNANLFVTGAGAVDLYYCTNLVGSKTTITITASGTLASGTGVFWEAASGLGTIAINSGATPSGNKNDAACTSCAGVGLTLSANNAYTVSLAIGGQPLSGLTGTSWVNDLANPNGNGAGHAPNTTGNMTAPTTWTQSSSAVAAVDAASFEETSSHPAEDDTPPRPNPQFVSDYIVTVFGFIVGIVFATIQRRKRVPFYASIMCVDGDLDGARRLAGHESGGDQSVAETHY